MKKLLFLIVFGAFCQVALAQSFERMSFLRCDSMVLSQPQLVLFLSSRIVQSPLKLFSKENVRKIGASLQSNRDVAVFRPRFLMIKPPEIIVHQKSFVYGSQIVFLEPIQVIIRPAQMEYR